MTPTTPSLLITDDDQDFRETLQAVFEPRGFQTLLAANGEEAVDIVRSHKVHLVLCDMHMPKMTGLEAIRTVHQMFKDLPCILMSADLDDDIVREARSVQVYSVLPKPVTRRQITDAVARALATTYGWNDLLRRQEQQPANPSDGRMRISIRASFKITRRDQQPTPDEPKENRGE